MNEKTKDRRTTSRAPVIRPPLILKTGSYTAADDLVERPNNALIQLVVTKISTPF